MHAGLYCLSREVLRPMVGVASLGGKCGFYNSTTATNAVTEVTFALSTARILLVRALLSCETSESPIIQAPPTKSARIQSPQGNMHTFAIGYSLDYFDRIRLGVVDDDVTSHELRRFRQHTAPAIRGTPCGKTCFERLNDEDLG